MVIQIDETFTKKAIFIGLQSLGRIRAEKIDATLQKQLACFSAFYVIMTCRECLHDSIPSN